MQFSFVRSHDLAGVFKNEPLPDVIVDLKTINNLAAVKVKFVYCMHIRTCTYCLFRSMIKYYLLVLLFHSIH